MIKVDDVLDTIEHPDVLVIYEDQYKDIKNMKVKKLSVWVNKIFINWTKLSVCDSLLSGWLL